MTIEDLIERDVQTIRPDETCTKAAAHMRDANVGSLIVTTVDDRPIGIVTDRDLVVRVLAPGAIIDPEDLRIPGEQPGTPMVVLDDLGESPHGQRFRARQGKSKIKLVKDGSRFLLIILKIAVFFSPLKVFVPLSAGIGGLGVFWYLYTYLTTERFTNMGVVLITMAVMTFGLGLVSEQIAQLRFERSEDHG